MNKKNFVKFCLRVSVLSLILVVVGMFPSVPAQAEGATAFVALGARGSACTQAAPCGSIQQAVDIAGPGGTVKVAEGTYIGQVTVTDEITIKGGYTTSNWDTPSRSAGPTIIDGGGTQRALMVTASMTVENSIIQNGLTNTPVQGTQEYLGGGLLCVDNVFPNRITVTLNNVQFRNNIARGATAGARAGGGGAALLCNLNLNNVTFENNRAEGGPGGATRGGYALGGGLLVSRESKNIIPGATPSVTGSNVTFTNNQALAGDGGSSSGSFTDLPDALGGGAAFIGRNVQITGITATRNRAEGGDAGVRAGVANGGALFFEIATGDISVGTLSDNSATGGTSADGIGGLGGGGAIMAIDSTLTLNRLQMLNNSSTGSDGSTRNGDAGGGAMYFTDIPSRQPSMTVNGTNLIIANNNAQAGSGAGGGGAIFSQWTTLTLAHATIVNNSTNGIAGGIIVLNDTTGSTPSTANISHSIIANHNNGLIAALVAQGTGDSLNLERTLFFGNSVNTGTHIGGEVINNNNPVTSGDPLFVGNGDYHISAGSAAIDQAIGSTTTDDIDGGSRPTGAAPDVGADEFDSADPTAISLESLDVGSKAGTLPVVALTLLVLAGGVVVLRKRFAM